MPTIANESAIQCNYQEPLRLDPLAAAILLDVIKQLRCSPEMSEIEAA